MWLLICVYGRFIVTQHEEMRKNSFSSLSIRGQCCIASFDRFRMVVIETKSEIVEVNDREMAAAQHSKMASHLNNGERSSLYFVRLSYTFLNRKQKVVKTQSRFSIIY